jgi:hypothetical protein
MYLRDMGSCPDVSGSGYGPFVGSCECGNKYFRPIKHGKILDQLRVYQLLKEKNRVPCFE